MKNLEPRECAYCKTQFQPSTYWQRYHVDACRLSDYHRRKYAKLHPHLFPTDLPAEAPGKGKFEDAALEKKYQLAVKIDKELGEDPITREKYLASVKRRTEYAEREMLEQRNEREREKGKKTIHTTPDWWYRSDGSRTLISFIYGRPERTPNI